MTLSGLYQSGSLLTRYVYEPALFSRIGVRPPYFALRDLAFDGTRFSALASAELPRRAEQTPMSAADIGRHGAIAGLCAVALSQRDETRRYYLASSAEYEGFYQDASEGPVQFESEVGHLDKRSATAHVRASLAGKTVATLDVSYTIFTETAFERLFRAHAQPTETVALGEAAPYRSALQGTLERSADSLRLHVGAIPKEACMGHFEGFPCMPVAILMHELSGLAGQLMGCPYYVAQGTVEANDLLWAGSEAVFEVERLHTEGEGQRFACRATSQGLTKGELTITLAALD